MNIRNFAKLQLQTLLVQHAYLFNPVANAAFTLSLGIQRPRAVTVHCGRCDQSSIGSSRFSGNMRKWCENGGL
ncbi:MAG: hypothetical protein COA37_07715 [Hoeflea sp.]|nr:MAG: hypothetical protein COA37_07715 [Hoeflea sp.]